MGSIIEYPPVRPLGFGLIFGTPFGAFFVFKDLQRLNKKGPFGFDLVFIRLLISTLWVSAISLAAYLIAIMPYGSSQPDPQTLLLGLVVVLSVIVFGVILIICISVPFALVIAGLFRIIALERVDDRSDKTSWKRAV